MKIAVKVVIAVIVGFSMAASVCAASGPMNNDNVINLVKGGMGEALILSSIDSSESQFDTSTDAQINLKKAGVSDAIIKRMIDKKAKSAALSTSAGTKVSTDKDVYVYGETIRVNFYNPPSRKKDWISIVPVGSPDDEGGDYKYMPAGVDMGVLSFDSPSPGKYEVRACYKYSYNVYRVSARQSFSVVGGPDMPRKIDPNNLFEANLPPNKGLVYIIREPSFATNFVDVQIKTDEKPIVAMPESSYFPFIVFAGSVNFNAKTGIELNNMTDTKREFRAWRTSETTLDVKPGFVYYLRLTVSPMPWSFFLDYVSHQEGAKLMKSYKLTMVQDINPDNVLKIVQPVPKPKVQTPEIQSSGTKSVEKDGKEKLKRLEAMKTLGLISQEEFEKEKAKIEGAK